ncbi:HNH endonuclease [Cystobacter fuscus]|uniref:HNH endonuclease n=1 Tax=Cystobacter fuscus TaxID=43 RepID=UPI0037C0FB05
MPTCIYCKENKPSAAFKKTEHVFPQSFGRFRDNLTLNDVVCDGCNKHFGDTIELYLGRDTIDGLNRFRFGFRDPQDYRTLGSRSTLTHTITSGFFAGARIRITGVDGELLQQPLPQIGLAQQEEGPYKWYLRESLPSKDELRALVDEGYRHIRFAEIKDPESVVADLKALGGQVVELHESRPAGYRGIERFETRTRMDTTFHRCIAKIGFNYLASQYGAETARMPQFDVVRRFIRYGEAPPSRNWTVDAQPIVINNPGHVVGHTVAVAWHAATETVLAQVSFHDQARYLVTLSVGGFILHPFKGRGHFFNLSSLELELLTPTW